MPPTSGTESPPSPIKWGFLAAAITHFANVFISGLTSRAPWCGLHGTMNLIIAGLLGYVVYFWNARFDTNLYVRRTLLRLSWAIDTWMLATLLGHLTVVIAVSRAPGVDEDSRHATSLGLIRSAAPWQPAISGILVGLWTAFAYVQFVAVENIRGVQLPVSGPLRAVQPNVTTIAEEVASSGTRPAADAAESNSVERFMSNSLSYYGPMLSAGFLCWTLGFPLTMGAPHVAVAGFCGTLIIFSLMVFAGLRTRMYGLVGLGASLGYSVMALLLNFIDGFSAPRSIRWINSICIMAANLVAVAISIYWYRVYAEEMRAECEKAPVTLFRRKREPSADDPMDYFMAGVAREEDV